MTPSTPKKSAELVRLLVDKVFNSRTANHYPSKKEWRREIQQVVESYAQSQAAGLLEALVEARGIIKLLDRNARHDSVDDFLYKSEQAIYTFTKENQ